MPHIIFGRNTGGKTSKIKWLFELNLILSILKALQDLGVLPASPLDSNCKDNSITQNVWSRMLFLMPKTGHRKNGSWIQILDMALKCFSWLFKHTTYTYININL